MFIVLHPKDCAPQIFGKSKKAKAEEQNIAVFTLGCDEPPGYIRVLGTPSSKWQPGIIYKRHQVRSKRLQLLYSWFASTPTTTAQAGLLRPS